MSRLQGRWSAAMILELVVWAAVLVLAVGVPALVFTVNLQFERGTLASLAASRAVLVTQRITANPQLWRFEEYRLIELVRQSVLPGDEADHRSVLDAEGRVIAESAAVDGLAPPLIVHRAPLHDAGNVVGWIQVERSIRPLIVRTAMLGALSLAVAALVLSFLRWVPLRALRRLEAELEHKAFHDDLTGLHNRDAFRRLLDQAVVRAAHLGSVLAVLYVDLDRFKSINDTLGHDAGDQVLRGVADRLRAGLHGGDLAARLSGDEFAVLVEGLKSDQEAAAVADALLARFEDPFVVGGRNWHLSCSIGVSLFPKHAREPDKLLAYADTAMLDAKTGGRSVRKVYDERMLDSVARRVHIEDDLRGALARHEFLLHYQPLIELDGGRVRGVEALLRWQHPLRGLVSPGEFIPVLEDLGLIHAVGQWAIVEACRQMRRWMEDGHDIQSVSVNVSALQFARAGDFVEQVRLALLETGLPPERLQLELTEGILMSDSDRAVEVLGDLKALGVSLAIDDFGTGYSSLAYLRRFPVTTLKVDRSFVRDMCCDPKDASIVKAVIQLAHSLGLVVTAEGIEEAEQLVALRALGCDNGQGYLLGRPAAAEQVRARLQPA